MVSGRSCMDSNLDRPGRLLVGPKRNNAKAKVNVSNQCHRNDSVMSRLNCLRQSRGSKERNVRNGRPNVQGQISGSHAPRLCLSIHMTKHPHIRVNSCLPSVVHSALRLPTSRVSLACDNNYPHATPCPPSSIVHLPYFPLSHRAAPLRLPAHNRSHIFSR